MKLVYFFMWLAGGGLVGLEAYASFRLLKSAERIEDAEDERMWQYLMHPGRS